MICGNAEGGNTDATCDIHHIAHYRAGRGSHARAWPSQYDLLDVIAFDHHHIGAAFKLTEWRCGGHETRRHALFQTASCHLGDAQQFDTKAHVSGVIYVLEFDPLDALEFDRVEINLRAKSNRGEQRQFVTRINPTHIKVGIRFQIAKLRAFIKEGVVAAARLFHIGQDVVTSAVHHAHHSGDLIAC